MLTNSPQTFTNIMIDGRNRFSHRKCLTIRLLKLSGMNFLMLPRGRIEDKRERKAKKEMRERGNGWEETTGKDNGVQCPYSIVECRGPQLLPVLGSQPAGDSLYTLEPSRGLPGPQREENGRELQPLPPHTLNPYALL